MSSTKSFTAAINHPGLWCISGRCFNTNWGGHDRLHHRSVHCPEYRESEIAECLRRSRARDRAALNPKFRVRKVDDLWTVQEGYPSGDWYAVGWYHKHWLALCSALRLSGSSTGLLL